MSFLIEGQKYSFAMRLVDDLTATWSIPWRLCIIVGLRGSGTKGLGPDLDDISQYKVISSNFTFSNLTVFGCKPCLHFTISSHSFCKSASASNETF